MRTVLHDSCQAGTQSARFWVLLTPGLGDRSIASAMPTTGNEFANFRGPSQREKTAKIAVYAGCGEESTRFWARSRSPKSGLRPNSRLSSGSRCQNGTRKDSLELLQRLTRQGRIDSEASCEQQSNCARDGSRRSAVTLLNHAPQSRNRTAR